MDSYVSIAQIRERSDAMLSKEAKLASLQPTAAKSVRPFGVFARHGTVGLRDGQMFSTLLRVPAGKSLVVELTYEEVLHRAHGLYRHIIRLQPHMPVGKMRILVRINERERIDREKLHVAEWGPGRDLLTNEQLAKLPQESGAIVQTSSSAELSAADVFFEPRSGGQLAVLYDLQRAPNAGHLEVVNGYFVHFFAPPPGPRILSGSRHVLFLLDATFTMAKDDKWGRLKNSMRQILKELQPKDFFNILCFGSDISSLNLQSVPASKSAKSSALAFLDGIPVGGNTSLFSGLKVGLDMLRIDEAAASATFLFVVTDGGTNPLSQDRDGDRQEVLGTLGLLNGLQSQIPIHTLGIGPDADEELLRLVASRNRGVHKALPVSPQLEAGLRGFFRQISKPLLQDLVIRYMEANELLEALVSQHHVVSRDYFDGGEVVLAGRVKESLRSGLELRVSGRNGLGKSVHLRSRGRLRSRQELGGSSKFVERLWAYLTVRNLIGRKLEARNDTRKAEIHKAILHLSQKYNFLTEATSLVVVPLELPKSPKGHQTDSTLEQPPSSPHGFSAPTTSSRNSGKWLFLEESGEIDVSRSPALKLSDIDDWELEAEKGGVEVSVRTGQPREEVVLELSAMSSAKRRELLAAGVVGDLPTAAVDPLFRMSLSQRIAAANPNGTSLSWSFGRVEPVNQASQPLLSRLSPGVASFVKTAGPMPACSAAATDIVVALDLSGGDSRQYGLAGPGSRHVAKKLVARLLALLPFANIQSRVGLVIWRGSPKTANGLYPLHYNQHPNALSAVLDKAGPGDVRLPVDNVFRVAYRMLKEADKGGLRRRKLLLVSATESFQRFKSASSALRKRGVDILVAAAHQRDPRHLARLLSVVGQRKDRVFTHTDPLRLLAALCH